MNPQLPIAARAYIAGISAAAAAAAIAVWGLHAAGAGLPAFLIVTALGALAHAYPIQGFRHQAYQVTLPFIILAAAMFSALELIAFIVIIHIAEQLRVRRRAAEPALAGRHPLAGAPAFTGCLGFVPTRAAGRRPGHCLGWWPHAGGGARGRSLDRAGHGRAIAPRPSRAGGADRSPPAGRPGAGAGGLSKRGGRDG